MNPENTNVVIRKRSVGEVLNLAFLMIARYLPQMAYASMLALPVCLLPWVLFWVLSLFYPDWVAMLYDEFEMTETWMVYLAVSTAVVVILEPLITTPLTLLMGQLVFGGKPDWRRLRAEYMESLPQIFYYRFLWRITTFRWAFCSEVILLERNPWLFAGKSGRRTTTQRCKDIYWRDYESVFRWFISFFWIGALLVSTMTGVCVLRYFIMGYNDQYMVPSIFLFYWPALLILASLYLCVVRFLAYLDFRIRSEGWDLDLKIREECARLDIGRYLGEEEEE